MYILYIYICVCVCIHVYIYQDKNLTLAEKLFSSSFYYSTHTLYLSIYTSARVNMRYATSFLSFFPSLRLYLCYTCFYTRTREEYFFSFLSFSKSFFSFSRARQFTTTREKILKIDSRGCARGKACE